MSNNSEATKRTVVEEGTRFKGDLTSSCPIDVRGRVEGEIEAPSLTVSAKGAVHGRAKVGSVRSEGELSGEFEAETIELSGTVKDQTVIRARSIEVRLSSARGQQVLFGDCELSVGDEPTEHDVVEEPEVVQASVAAEEQPAAAMEAAPAEAEAEAEAAVDSAADDEDREAAEASASDEAQEQAELPSNLEEALSSEAEANGGGKKRKKAQVEQNGAEVSSGWSQPPSQPPPAAN